MNRIVAISYNMVFVYVCFLKILCHKSETYEVMKYNKSFNLIVKFL